ncbi:hypothetical protein E2562_007024 [Oryza meyeriana var. granulata]|uniref:Uncharacterized protein n=1 Tax=Oryza meyeriana var. granulata TaxID=110450 RepID=A0A6G1EA77_9ORYZ|nr:hypothetical protein E2562_007024 [Oryza meyeriana var. granulata]
MAKEAVLEREWARSPWQRGRDSAPLLGEVGEKETGGGGDRVQGGVGAGSADWGQGGAGRVSEAEGRGGSGGLALEQLGLVRPEQRERTGKEDEQEEGTRKKERKTKGGKEN